MKSYFVFLKRNKLYTAIQVFGLAVALGFVILLASYARTEYMVGKTQTMADKLYVMGSHSSAGLTVGTGPEICPKIPQIKGYTRVGGIRPWDVKVGDNSFSTNAMALDSTFFQYFDYDLRGCDRKKVLASPTDILVSEEFAKRAFPDGDAIGKTITLLGQEEPLTVVGVMETFDEDDIFTRSEIFYSMLVEEQSRQWLDNFGSIVTFVTLNEGASVEEVKEALLDKYMEVWGSFWPREPKDGSFLGGVSLIPLNEFYFSNIATNSGFRHSDSIMVWILVCVALVLLVSAVFNYVNLTTALIGKRAKEIATRRLLGDSMAEAVGRNLLESLVFTAGCFVFGCMVAVMMRPWFEMLLDSEILLFADFFSVLAAIALLLVVSLVAGLIPAVIVARFKPIDVVKGSFRFQSKMRLSRVFIVVQNLISTTLIAIGLVMPAQMHHLATLPMGYRTEGLVEIESYTYSTYVEQLTPIRDRLLAMPQVKRIGWAMSMPWNCQTNGVQEKGSTDEPVSSWTFYSAMDTTCMSMLGFETVEQYSAPEDGKHYVTEETRDRYGISADNPLVGGQVSGTASYPVCGVIKDYRSFNPVDGNSMADGHNIIAVMMNPNRAAFMMVELSEEGMKDVEESIKQMQETCRAVTKEACGVEKDFDIRTVDDIFAEPMEELANLLLMVLCFMLVSVLISALGLFAMSISYTEQQSKQIALRKVMGASVTGASWQLARPFILLSLLAAVLSTPLAIKGSQLYLELFSNRIDLPWWLLVVSVLVTLLIAFLSICWRTLSVARRNPVESIRTE